MTDIIGASKLDAFASLAEALGITVDGELNPTWFETPLGDAAGGDAGLTTVFHDDRQREALLEFVDETLGAPDNETEGDRIWVPLFSEGSFVVSAVVTARDGSVLLGFGVEYDRGGAAPTVELRAVVNVFQFSRQGTGSIDTSGSLPDWLILGRAGGTVDIEATAVLSTAAPAPDEPYLGGIGLGVSVPTSDADSLTLSLVLDRLQLPGTDAPRTFTLDVDSLSTIDDEVYEFLLGLIQAQADALDPADADTARFAGLAGVLGLRDVTDLPAFPLGDLIDRGAVAFTDWVNVIVGDDDALDAWLGELARLLGATPDPLRNAVTFTIDDVELSVGVRVETAPGDGLVLVPWAEATYGVRNGADVRAAADLLRFDTTTRDITAFPALVAHAVFGAEAHDAGARLLDGDPQIGTIRTGISLLNGRPAFALTLYDVVVGGVSHESLDLSSPAAALDAAAGVVDGAIVNAFQGLGRPGELALVLIGMDPPDGIDAIGTAQLLADPVGAVRGYWDAVVADTDALGEIVTAAAELLIGAAGPVPGTGTADDPWRLVVADGDRVDVALELFVEGAVVAVDLAIDVTGDRFGAAADGSGGAIPAIEAQLGLARLDVAGGTARFLPSLDAAAALRGDGAPLRLPLGEATLSTDAIGLTVSWSQSSGFGGAIVAPGLTLDVPFVLDEPVALPLPVITGGGLAFEPEPDWDAVELLVARLVERTGSSALTALLRLIGWIGNGPHLDLAALLDDPEAAIRSWMGDLVLDCDHIHLVLGQLNHVLSGLRHADYYGAGTADDPIRVTVGTSPRAPGLAVWTDTGCRRPLETYEELPGQLNLELVPDPDAIAAALYGAATLDRSTDLLLFGRNHLGQGIEQLADRIVGTDGVVGRPDSLPGGVTQFVLGDRGYRELMAAGIVGDLAAEIGLTATAVVHVGCEAEWAAADGMAASFDARVGQTVGTVPANGAGSWSIRLSLPVAAAADRPDLTGPTAQAARLAEVLSGRADPITVIAYGSAGAAAIHAAQTITSIERVVTVGAPWSPVATTGFSSGLGGDALRLLEQLTRVDTSDWPEDLLAQEIADDVRAQFLIDRARRAVPADLPSAAVPAIRAGLAVDAVFGHLDEDEVWFALGTFVKRGLTRRLDAAAAQPTTEPSSLHVGVGLPVIDTALAGVALGAGLTTQLVVADRGPTGDGFDVRYDPRLALEVRFGVEDGWLVGGPGAAQRDVEVRWMSARVEVPLESSDPATCAITLHDTNCFGVARETWKVARIDADGTVTSSTASEVHIMVGEIVDRLGALADARTASLVELLAALGVIRDGGYDPQGLDRLVYDTNAAIQTLLSSDRSSLASAIRSLAGAAGTGTQVVVATDGATFTVDLAGPTVAVDLAMPVPGLGAVSGTVALDRTGVAADVAIGSLDSATGGIQIVAAADSRTTGSREVAVRWQAPGGSVTTVPLVPAVSTERLGTVVAAVSAAAVARLGVDHLRSIASADQQDAIDTVLRSLGLVTTTDGHTVAGLPVGVFLDPAGWLTHAAPGWIADPLAAAVDVLDALAPLVAPGRVGTGWPLGNGVAVGYATVAGRLVLSVDVTRSEEFGGGANTVATTLGAGISIGLDRSIRPTLDSQVTIDGSGLALTIAPALGVGLVRPGRPALPLYPSGPGLGQALDAVATAVMPVVLDAVAEQRNNAAPSLRRSVGQVVFDLGTAMDLVVGGDFDEARITSFADDPAAALATRSGHLVTLGLSTLADALDPSGTFIRASASDSVVALELGRAPDPPVTIRVDATPGDPAIELTATFEIPEVGVVAIDPLRLSLTGASFEVQWESAGFDIGGGAMLFPLAAVRAGVGTAAADRLVALGLGFDATQERSVEFRWGLDANPPRVVVVDRSGGGDSEDGDVADVAVALVTLALNLVAPLAEDALGDDFFSVLDGVLFTAGTRVVDPTLIDDVDDVLALLDRLGQLAVNIADRLDPIEIGGVVEIGLQRDGSRIGITLDLSGDSLELAGGETTVSLVANDSWIRDPGDGLFTIWLFDRSGGRFDVRPDVELRGLGLRVSKSSGPLLDLGPASIDAIAVHLYFESQAGDIGLGAQIQLDGLSISPAGGGADADGQQNGVANQIMADAADGSSPAVRPSFSPSIAVQAPPGGDVGVTVRAGEPPGPWWIVVQRQLGPLYLEQFGFDATETDGTVTGISLLFDAKLEIFGLTAQVDQLGVHWTGGDVFDLGNWRVDLQGLAIAAEFSGVAISGGLLKTNIDGSIGYVGMLMGRFGVYGLSLFGGYTDQDGVPSFFVFGAVNGPIGGPPAFFLTGIGGGLGINRGLRVPADVGHMNEYPFVKALDPAARPAENPLDELRSLAEYFPPQNGTFWFAAGISFNSFALVDGVAVVSVSFGNGLEINLFGLARMALPRPEAALVSIELGLLARFSTSEGLFLIQAQLTENSWLLYPEVRLTGGFAFATWWKGANRGQFVLTIGGYHPDFSRDGYPVVPRVGLEWRVTDDIVVKGGSYFALTSEALMAGVEVVVSADFGFLWAEVRFGADGIVWFDPFYFRVSAYAKIKAGCRIKTWFGTIRISISLGATIVVQGPKFNGVATVEVGPFEASVPFGSKQKVPGEIVSWSEFVDKYLEAASTGVARGLTGITGKGTLPAATGGEASAPSSDGSLERPYQVFPEFEVMLVSPVPFEFLVADGDTTMLPVTSDLGLRPMNRDDLRSTLTLTLERFNEERRIWEADARIAKLLAGLDEERETSTAATWGTEGFPLGVWGEGVDPDPEAAPLPKGDVVIAPSRLRLVAEADLPEPTGDPIDYRRVDSGRRPLPLSATGRDRGAMINLAGSLAQPTTVAEAMIGARNQLFAAPAPAAPGLLRNPSRSGVGAASFARSRTAPPQFGSLTDGMLRSNPDGLASSVLPPRPAAAIVEPRAPFVSGFLTSGSGVVNRSAGTSVADGRIKRRSAPSVASVTGRLGRQLPLRLTQAQVPADVARGTLVSRGSLPRTDVGAAAVSYAGRRVGGAIGRSVVAGLAGPGRGPRTPRALDPGSTVRPGDVVVLTLPDPERDRGDERPSISIEGTARVALVRASGRVLHDEIVVDGQVVVPPRARFAIVQADGDVEAAAMSGASGRLESREAVAIGWHASSRLAAASGSIALGAGCIVHTEGTEATTPTGWVAANAFTRRASATTTTFDRPVQSVAIAVRSAAVERVRSMAIELRGARRVERNGVEVPPIVVIAGETAHLVFDIVPTEGPVSIRVVAGGDRRICGVLGAALEADEFAAALAERGANVITSRLRAGGGAGCAITWSAAPTPRRRRNDGGPPPGDGGRRRPSGSGVVVGVTEPSGGN